MKSVPPRWSPGCARWLCFSKLIVQHPLTKKKENKVACVWPSNLDVVLLKSSATSSNGPPSLLLLLLLLLLSAFVGCNLICSQPMRVKQASWLAGSLGWRFNQATPICVLLHCAKWNQLELGPKPMPSPTAWPRPPPCARPRKVRPAITGALFHAAGDANY